MMKKTARRIRVFVRRKITRQLAAAFSAERLSHSARDKPETFVDQRTGGRHRRC